MVAPVSRSPAAPRALVYARYSSGNQRDASIEDQLRVCRARAEREGWVMAEVYADAAISGAAARLSGAAGGGAGR